MLTTLNTKLLMAVIALLTSIAGYLGYQNYLLRQAEAQYNQVLDMLQNSTQPVIPGDWGKALQKP